MTIPVVIFSFECDHACTVVAAGSAIRAGFGPVFVEIDGERPLPRATCGYLERMGCVLRETRFRRNGNLRGMETYRGMLESYLHAFETSGARHLLKLDADTYVVKGDLLKQAAKDDVSAAAMSFGPYPFYGWAMLLSRRLVEGIRDWLDEWDTLPGYGRADFPEDKATGTMSMRLGLGETRQWEFNPEGGFGAGYLYSRAQDSLECYASKYEVITFGNRHLIPGAKSSCAKRDDVASQMMAFDKLLTENAHALRC